MQQINLKILRVVHDFNIKDMAAKLDMSPITYSQKEKGNSEFTLNEMFVIRQKVFKNKYTLEEIFLPRNSDNTEINGGGIDFTEI